jgi:hypothetical protein
MSQRGARFIQFTENRCLYMFRELLAHPQEVHLVYRVLIMSVGYGTVAVALILNNLIEKCITLVSLY